MGRVKRYLKFIQNGSAKKLFLTVLRTVEYNCYLKIQKNKVFTLVDAMRFISFRFKLTEVELFNEEDTFQLEDWKFLENYLRIQSLSNSA